MPIISVLFFYIKPWLLCNSISNLGAVVLKLYNSTSNLGIELLILDLPSLSAVTLRQTLVSLSQTLVISLVAL